MGSTASKHKRDAASTRKSAPKPNNTAGSVAAATTAGETTTTTDSDTTAVPLPDRVPGGWADIAMAMTCYEGKPTKTMETLAQMTAVREPVWRDSYAVECLIPDSFIIWEALQVQCIGAVTAFPCEHCRRGSGLWTQCVTLQDFLGGSCANCDHNSPLTRCSLRSTTPAKAAEENTAAAASAMTASPAPSNAPAAVLSAATSTPCATPRATASASQERAKRLHRMYETTAIACNAAAAALASAASAMSYLAEEYADEAGIHRNVD
ncbi:hypothetical protein CNMCM5793_002936 [Aspergillus hiratsukae]|uniref:Uncharacterized protein n=1 Tax=Aspergillus hiratsukae TaxID=1194566 RepID=A0A8H6QK64_9EURO|nr:hypothetical protein CNMCM5793_002936 [Aspergillus hiratsukae]KAF7173989.1 hypothetical protein CNMCM6106_008078 [Aspergillus hiratsukae]